MGTFLSHVKEVLSDPPKTVSYQQILEKLNKLKPKIAQPEPLLKVSQTASTAEDSYSEVSREDREEALAPPQTALLLHVIRFLQYVWSGQLIDPSQKSTNTLLAKAVLGILISIGIGTALFLIPFPLFLSSGIVPAVLISILLFSALKSLLDLIHFVSHIGYTRALTRNTVWSIGSVCVAFALAAGVVVNALGLEEGHVFLSVHVTLLLAKCSAVALGLSLLSLTKASERISKAFSYLTQLPSYALKLKENSCASEAHQTASAFDTDLEEESLSFPSQLFYPTYSMEFGVEEGVMSEDRLWENRGSLSYEVSRSG